MCWAIFICTCMLIKKIFHFEIAEKNSINAYLIHIMMSESLTLCTLIRLKKIYKKNKKQIPVPLLNSQGYQVFVLLQIFHIYLFCIANLEHIENISFPRVFLNVDYRYLLLGVFLGNILCNRSFRPLLWCEADFDPNTLGLPERLVGYGDRFETRKNPCDGWSASLWLVCILSLPGMFLQWLPGRTDPQPRFPFFPSRDPHRLRISRQI